MQEELFERRLVGVVKVKNHTVTWASAAFAQLMGYERDELTGRPTRIFYEDDDSYNDFWNSARDALNRGEAFGGKVRRVRKDGSVGWFDVNCFRPEPGVDEHETTLVDISDKQAALAALAQSEKRLKEAQSIAHLGSWQLDRAHGVVAWSDEMFRIYGLDPCTGTPSLDVFVALAHPEDKERLQEAYCASIRSRVPVDTIYRVVPATGGLRHVQLCGEHEFGADGSLIRSFGTAQDVGGRVVQEASLRQERARLRSIFLAMAEGVILHGPDGQVVESNPAAEEILGLSRDQLLGRTSMDPQWRCIHEDGTPFPGVDHPAVVSLRTGKAIRDQVMAVQSADRGLRWISINSQPIAGSGAADPGGVVVTFVDVTERREAFQRIQQLAQRIDLVREEERQHIARELHEGIAQDLFAAQLALKHLESQARGRTGVMQAYEDLKVTLDLCMAAARRMANNLRPAAFAHMILSTALQHHVEGFAALSSLTINICEIAPFPQLDETTNLAFFRATQELLTNIAKHANATTVNIRLRTESGRLWIEIDDDGVGIPDGALKKSGSLGLVGIRERFVALGGGLAIHKREPHGTRVAVFIPEPRPYPI